MSAFGDLPEDQIGEDVASRIASGRNISEDQLSHAKHIKRALMNIVDA